MRGGWRRRRRRRWREPGALTLAADTVVAAGRRILPKAESEAEARACLALLSGRRHRVHSARHPDRRRGPRPPPAVELDRHLQAAERGRDRRLSRQRRMARQGGRLCHPGPRRGPGPRALRLLFGRDGPAPVRDARLAARRRLSAWLSGSTRKGSARIARSWSRTAPSSRPRSSCRACAPAPSSPARLTSIAGIATLEDGSEAVVEPRPA